MSSVNVWPYPSRRISTVWCFSQGGLPLHRCSRLGLGHFHLYCTWHCNDNVQVLRHQLNDLGLKEIAELEEDIKEVMR